MFEKATRMKLRWGYRGYIGVEDLWDLSVEELDTIFKGLARKVKAQEEESLLDTKSDEDKALAIQIGIVRHIVSVKLEEKESAKAAASNKARKQKLLSLMEEKQDEDLKGLSADELQAMIDNL